jgi:hypothetical protein
MLLFPVEMESYSALAERTMRLFEDLFLDYTRPIDWGREHDLATSLFVTIKESFKMVKERFAGQDRLYRTSIFDWFLVDDKSCNYRRFWGSSMKRLKKRILAYSADGDDYTDSFA